jgi:DNA polymerase
MFIGEQPAREEDRYGFPFAGRTGSEFDRTYLPLSGLLRDDIYVTNARKCSSKGYDNPTLIEAASCAACHLPAELAAVRPRVVVPMGAVACSLFPSITLELDHGLPLQASLVLNGSPAWSGAVFPLYHPAAGLHDGRWMIPLMDDFTSLGAYLSGGFTGPADQYPNPSYHLFSSAHDLNWAFCAPDFAATDVLAMDTEIDEVDGAPYCLSFSAQPGTGCVIMADNYDVLQALNGLLHQAGNPRGLLPLTIAFHYALFDLSILGRMGVNINRDWIDDTMLRVYHRANLPQGLKALCWRLCGMKMTNYDDLVNPYFHQAAFSYLSIFTSRLSGRLFELRPIRGRSGQFLRPRKGASKDLLAVYRRASRLLESSASPSPHNLLSRYQDWPEHDRSIIENEMSGPFPRRSIRLVPPDKLIAYSAADADGTLRLLHHLRGLQSTPYLAQ